MTSQRYISPEITNSNTKHFREGKEEGAKEKAIEIAHKLKAAGMPLESIASMTGLPKEEIEKL